MATSLPLWLGRTTPLLANRPSLREGAFSPARKSEQNPAQASRVATGAKLDGLSPRSRTAEYRRGETVWLQTLELESPRPTNGPEGPPQSAIFQTARAMQAVVNEGDQATLLEQLNAIRGNLRHNVKEFLGTPRTVQEPAYNISNPGNVTINYIRKVESMSSQSISITGSTVGNINQVAAQNISDSFKTIAESAAQPDLKQKLDALAKSVEEMIKGLPPAQAAKQQQITQDLKTLATEATSPQPRKAWYELSANGLIEAATAVGKIAEPVITAAKAVLTFLG